LPPVDRAKCVSTCRFNLARCNLLAMRRWSGRGSISRRLLSAVVNHTKAAAEKLAMGRSGHSDERGRSRSLGSIWGHAWVRQETLGAQGRYGHTPRSLPFLLDIVSSEELHMTFMATFVLRLNGAVLRHNETESTDATLHWITLSDGSEHERPINLRSS
jgi:hypothetical protein